MIQLDEIKKLAALARIELTETEIVSLQKDIDAILLYISELDSIPMPEKKNEPRQMFALKNIFRDDNVSHEPHHYSEALLCAAPSRKGNHIAVKKIL